MHADYIFSLYFSSHHYSSPVFTKYLFCTFIISSTTSRPYCNRRRVIQSVKSAEILLEAPYGLDGLWVWRHSGTSRDHPQKFHEALRTMESTHLDAAFIVPYVSSIEQFILKGKIQTLSTHPTCWWKIRWGFSPNPSAKHSWSLKGKTVRQNFSKQLK